MNFRRMIVLWICILSTSVFTNAQISYKTVEIPDSISFLDKLNFHSDITAEEISYDSSRYNGAYKLLIKQPIDHNNPDIGYFLQKVYLTHKDETKPMVAYLDGYSTNNGNYINELANYLDANHIHVEHRFFGESIPDDSIHWSKLNIKQAAADHHKIIQLLKNIYKDKWISTGISKGGQTAMFHKRFYPDDVVITVPYVAPLNLEVADQRIYDFLDNVGTKECRDKLRNIQRYLIKKHSKTFPIFKEKVEKFGFKYYHELDSIFELSVFELEFAFWQWGGNCKLLPGKIKDPEDAVNLLFAFDTHSFFEQSAVDAVFPFLYQAYTELGLYGYRTEMFDDDLIAYKNNVDNCETFIPKRFHLKYSSNAMEDVNNWLKQNGNNMIYIYGELDAWSSTAFEPGKNTNALKIVKEGGSHGTRIRNLPENQKELVLSTLEKWLDIKTIQK